MIMEPLTVTATIITTAIYGILSLGRHCVKHFTLIVSVNSLQQFYKVNSVANLIFQIKKSRLREVK